MILNSLKGNLVGVSSKTSLLSFTFLLLVVLGACQKKETYNETPDKVAGLMSYSEKVGADPATLLAFHKSLSKLQKSDGTSSVHCLKGLRDNPESRNSFLNCLALKGLSGLNKEFLEELVGVRLLRMHYVHERESARTLKLLNWIFDLSVEQYALSNPESYWLEKNIDGKWTFKGKDRKNHDDYDFLVGDLVLSISPTELSTLIPQYSYSQRRLTHSMVYRGAYGHRKEHFIESEFEEGVRYKYRDIYRNKDLPFETIVLRYEDPSISSNQLMQLRRNAADYAATKVGQPYGFTTDPKDGFACHFLTGLSFADAFINANNARKKELGIEDIKSVLTSGFSPMREGLSRSYAEKFGMHNSVHEYPTAGDFLTSDLFDPVAIFVRPEKVQDFSDLYTVAEAFVDALDRGSALEIDDDVKKNVEPLLRDRHKLSELIGMARKLKRHTLFRESMTKANVSLERIELMTVQELKDVLDRLDSERKTLISAARNEIGLNILGNAFGKAVNLRLKEATGKEKKFSMGDFLLALQADREARIFEFHEYVHSQKASDQAVEDNLRQLREYLDQLIKNMLTRNARAKVTDDEFEALRKLTVKINFRLIDQKSDHKEVDKIINKVIVGFDEKDFEQLQLFINNLDFDAFKDLINLGQPKTYTTVYAPSRPYMDPNWRPTTYENSDHFASYLPVLGDALTRIEKHVDDGDISQVELRELEESLRVYARFLMSVPSLKKKIGEYDNREEELQKIIKNTPYIASSISNETLIEFGLYKTVASKVVEKLDSVRTETLGMTQLWQMPPWIQRSWIELIFTGVPVLQYVQ